MEIGRILEENLSRNKKLDARYNPVSGEGSPLPRTKVTFSDMGDLWLPNTFIENRVINQLIEYKSFKRFQVENTPYFPTIESLYKYFITERFIHDFEFWANSTIQIWDKLSLEYVKFRSRQAQLKLLLTLESMRLSGTPIRIVLLKARQWGGSTLVQLYMMWIQQCHKRNWHLAVCAQDDSAAKNIRGMYTRAAKTYPKEFGKITLTPYEGSAKNRVCEERGGIIGVGSVNNPDQFRSFNYTMIHMSELGSWGDTLVQNAEQLAQSLKSTVSKAPYTIIVEESTAKGVGNYFHNEYLAASRGETGYEPVFVGWWEIDMYRKHIDDYQVFISSLTEYDWFLWETGATLEGINYYNYYKNSERYSDWQMMEEFPTTPEEAFQSGKQRVFAPVYVKRAEKNCIKPEFIGHVEADAQTGEKALSNIRFVKSPNGNLRIWLPPEKTVKINGKEYYVLNRYAGFGDVGGRNKKADHSVLKVFDRFFMLEGGKPEVAAVWQGNCDQDLFAWKCAQIGTAYNDMLLAIEVNVYFSRSSGEMNEGDHSLTVLDKLSDFYRNLFIRNDFERIDKDFIPKYGFHTDRRTKPMIIDFGNAALRDELYVERDIRACNEMDAYEYKENGTMGATQGMHDDHVITTCGGVWLCLDYMPPVQLVEVTPDTRSRKANKGIISEASF